MKNKFNIRLNIPHVDLARTETDHGNYKSCLIINDILKMLKLTSIYFSMINS